MKKRLLGILLSFALMLTMMPALSLPAFADASISDPNDFYAEMANGSGLISIETDIDDSEDGRYEIDCNKTIDLKGHKVTTGKLLNFENYPNVTLTIKDSVGGGSFICNGMINLYASGTALNLESGTLTINNDITISQGSFNMTGGVLNGRGKVCGINSGDDTLTISGGTVDVRLITIGNATITGGKFKYSPSSYLTDGYVVAKKDNYYYVGIKYPLWVGNTQVTSLNASDIKGNGTASYNAETNTLTLNGFTATIDDYYMHEGDDAGLTRNPSIYYDGTDTLNVVVTGTNQIDVSANRTGINAFNGNINISGTGSLNINTGSDPALVGKNITLTSGTINVSGLKGSTPNYGIMAISGDITISENANVTTVGSYAALKAYEGTVNNAVAGTGWTNTDGTEGKTKIAVSTDGQDLSSYKKVQFPAPVEYTVKFNSNGGSGTMSDAVVEKGSNVQFPACTFTAPEEKEFDYWTVSGSEEHYAAGDSITVAETYATEGVITVTANWKDIIYNVTTETEGSGTLSADPTSGKMDTEVTLTVTPAEHNKLKSIEANTVVETSGTPTTDITTISQLIDLIGNDALYLDGDSDSTKLIRSGENQIQLLLSSGTANLNFDDEQDTIDKTNSESGIYKVSHSFGFVLTFTVYDNKITQIDLDSDQSLPDGYLGTYKPASQSVELTKVDDSTYTFSMPSADVKVKATFEEKTAITPTVSIENWTYGDDAKSPSVSGNTGEGKVTYTYAAKGSTDFTSDVPTKAGEYTVKATVAETADYMGGEATDDFTIAKKAVTITGITVGDKEYDGNATATFDATKAAITGIVGDDALSFTAGSASFADETVGADKTVTFQGFALSGEDAANYTLSAQPESVTASITATDKSALNSAITAAEEYYNSIKENADYTDIANTLKNAIDAAKAVANNDNQTAAQVSGAKDTLNNAVDAAKADVKDVDDTKAAAAVTDAINNLPENPTAANEEAVKAARDAYTALTDDQKAKVSKDTLKKLTDAEEAVAKDKADQAAADAVTNKINALPENPTAADEAKVKEVRDAYEALTNDQKAKVSEEIKKKLTDAEAAVDKDIADKAAADAVTDKINALPANPTAADEEAVKKAKEAYDKLTDDQKAKINSDTLKKLENAVKAVEEARKEAADTEVANKVKEQIEALPAAGDVKTSDKEAIEAARKAYDALTDDQKAKVPADAVKKLTDAETVLKTAEEAEKAPASTSKPVLAAKGIAKGKTAVNLSWNKVSGADRYVIYFARCNQKGRSYVLKKVKTVNGKTLKWSKGKLAKNTAYRFYVVAQKKSGKSYKNIAKSKAGHFYTGNVKGKYTNPKSLTLKKSAYTLKKGKTATIKASVSKVKTNKKLATSHAATYRYTSNNPAVATVNAKGKVNAKAKGTAVIYVQTINGIWKTCKVTVN